MARAPRESSLSRARLSLRPGAHRARILAVTLALLPALCLAAGSPSFPRRIKSVHELIVEGDRPEISACLYSAELAVSKSREFERIRWSERISDESVVREYRLAADWVRVTKFEASALTQGPGLFSRQRWVDVLVECQQVNEKAPIVSLRLKLEEPASQPAQ
jgi:hypothetical protein